MVVARDVGSVQGSAKTEPPFQSVTRHSGSDKQGGAGEAGSTLTADSAAFLSASELAARLRGFRTPVWSQLRRLDGVVPSRAVEIPEILLDTYR